MSINTKIRLALLASAFALAAAAPAAFADSGTWRQGFHTDPATGSENPPAVHSKELMEKKIVSSNAAPDTGTWYQGFHTDPPNGSENPPAVHSKELMEKRIVPSN